MTTNKLDQIRMKYSNILLENDSLSERPSEISDIDY